MWLKDPKTNEKSVTVTAFTAGLTILLLKVAISGIQFGAFKAENFSGTDFAAAIGALGAIYAARKATDKSKD